MARQKEETEERSRGVQPKGVVGWKWKGVLRCGGGGSGRQAWGHAQEGEGRAGARGGRCRAQVGGTRSCPGGER